MLSAREFYYSKIAPDEAGKSYQQAHQSAIYDEKSSKENLSNIVGHVPNLSNDILIESYIENLIASTSGTFSDSISRMFVAKRKDFLANAGAIHAGGRFEGDLVFFYVGLSDLCFQYAILFGEFINLCALRQELPDDSEDVMLSMTGVVKGLNKLANAQLEWGINGNEIRLKDETLIYPSDHLADNAARIATLMDRVVLGHEIAHHLLGHTGRDATISELLEIRIAPFLNQGLSAKHRKEIEADLLGLALPLWSTFGDSSDQAEFEVALGALLFYTVISHLKCSMFFESESHPSAATRYNHVLKFIRTHFKLPVLDSLIDDIERFQALLFTTQDRGLGLMQQHRLSTNVERNA